MVHYTETDIISMQNFTYSWRITDERWDRLSTTTLQDIFPLSVERSEIIGQQGRIFRDNSPIHHTIVGKYSKDFIELHEDSIVQQWMNQLPIEKDEMVYVSWGSEVLIIEWSEFIKIYSSLWYPFDAIDVFDDTLKWAVLLGPEEMISFVKEI